MSTQAHSHIAYFGPKVYLMAFDFRCERKKHQVASPASWKLYYEAMSTIPEEVDHLVLVVGIPMVCRFN